MSENKLVKYEDKELLRLNNSIVITNKILSLAVEFPDLIIERTLITPGIKCFAKHAIIEIEGNSIRTEKDTFSLDSFQVWIEKYHYFQIKPITVRIKLEKLGDYGARTMANIFIVIEHMSREFSEPKIVEWYIKEDDQEMFEAYKDYAYIYGSGMEFRYHKL